MKCGVAFFVSQLRVRVSTTAFKAERYMCSKDFIINQTTTETIVDVFYRFIRVWERAELINRVVNSIMMKKGREVRHQRDAILAFLVEGNFALNPHVTRSKPDSFRDSFNDHSINAGKKTA